MKKISLLLLAALLFSGEIYAAAAPAVLTSPPPQEAVTREKILAELRLEPTTRELLIDVEVYKGLAVLHGWVLNRQIALDVTNRVRDMRGVDRVFSYIEVDNSQDDDKFISHGFRDNVTRSNGIRNPTAILPAHGKISSDEDLARRVQVNLAADALTTNFDVWVDGYSGLAVIHGNVPDDSAKRSIENVASHTLGVEAVLSFVVAGESPELTAPGDWPLAIELRRPELESGMRSTEPTYVRSTTPCPPATR